ncbi:DDE-type integrase/transposase/recombinase [Shimia isoporae]
MCEMLEKISGEWCHIWRSVDREGEVLESHVTET